jgi:hypothetical protein
MLASLFLFLVCCVDFGMTGLGPGIPFYYPMFQNDCGCHHKVSYSPTVPVVPIFHPNYVVASHKAEYSALLILANIASINNKTTSSQ